MSQKQIFGPWANPQIEEKCYEAVVTSMQHITTGENESMLCLELYLPEVDHSLRTRVYLPAKHSVGCQHRLWYLCQALNIEAYDLIESTSLAQGRKLLIKVKTVTAPMANYGEPYSDVDRFMHTDNKEKEEEPVKANED